MKPKNRLFIIDFDGTLVKDDKTISQEDIRTLDRLRQKKIIVTIATGRSVYSFDKALKDMGMAGQKRFLPADYVIFSTGAGIITFPGGKVIFKKDLPASDIGKITDYFDRQKFDYMVHRAIPDTKQFLYKTHGRPNPDFQARLALYREFAVPLERRRCYTDPATEVLAVIPGGIDRETLEMIKKALSDFSVIQATSPLDHRSSWIEVFHKNVSKSKTAAWLIKRLGVSRENVISVGNDYNDQDLLDWAGKGFVVENAPDRLKQAFKTVPSNNQNGVSRAAEKAGWIDQTFDEGGYPADIFCGSKR